MAEGRVVPILQPYWRADAEISLVYPSTDYLPTRMERLIEHLRSAVAQGSTARF